MSKKPFLLVILLAFTATIVGGAYFLASGSRLSRKAQQAQIVNAFQNNSSSRIYMLPTPLFKLIKPVDEFEEKITKKPFGIFITPETSPVENDRFIGYHTGVDVEFTDVFEDVSVKAIADGTILARTYASGYGGVIVIRHILNGVPIIALYGHLDSARLLPLYISQVKAGDQIGILGDDHSKETDGTRKHLHFSFRQDNGNEKIDFRGYVQTKEELAGWLNPLDFYK